MGGGDSPQPQSQSCETPGATQACFPFATGKADVGICKSGTQACNKVGEFGQLGPCTGAVGPAAETCGDGIDNDCDGVVDNGCAPDAGTDSAIVDVQVAAPAPVDAQIEFHHLPDTASMMNCLKIQVNGGPEIDLGCNQGPPLLSAQVQAQPPPFCNIVRLNLYSNGLFNKTTANAADVPRSFIFQQLGPGNFMVQCNDNYDNDFNDLNLTMNAVGNVLFTIENTSFSCN
jgi:hypothetical protein